jgi:broad specificity phosphatase PhoE
MACRAGARRIGQIFPRALHVATLRGVQGSSNETSRLALIRHGRSSHVHSGWMTAAGFRAWRSAYEAAGIRNDECVPSAVQQLVRRGGVVLCSDAPRAVASARLLAPAEDLVVSPLLRELELEGPDLGRFRLPLVAWAVAVGLRALLSMIRRRYPSPAEASRLEEAASLIDQLAMQHRDTVIVTHASFRRLLWKRLMKAGWHDESLERSVRHWSAWLLTKNPAARATLGAPERDAPDSS